MTAPTITEQMNTTRQLLIAFDNGSYKKITSSNYDHKEWIVIKRPNGKQVFINTNKVKYIEEL